jgi:hypothetical protein
MEKFIEKKSIIKLNIKEIKGCGLLKRRPIVGSNKDKWVDEVYWRVLTLETRLAEKSIDCLHLSLWRESLAYTFKFYHPKY